MAMTKAEYLNIAKSSIANKSNAKNGYRIVITPHFEDDTINIPIEFDIVSTMSINSSSDITTYPLVNGDTVADHMIRQPITLSISGAFSLLGNKPSFNDNPTNVDRLTFIEQYFERIKNEGIFCDVTTINRSSESLRRFEQRRNMVLTNISWTEQQSSLQFSFTFNEVMTVQIDEPIVATDIDENLPSITEPNALDFTEDVLDTSQLLPFIIDECVRIGIVEEEFLDAFGSIIAAGILAAVGVAIIITTVTVTTGVTSVIVALGGTAAGLASAGPVGWIAAGASLVVAALVALGCWIARVVERNEYRIETFKKYEDDLKNQQEIERFTNYVSSIFLQLEQLEDYCKVYSVPTNEEQECLIYIDDNYYIFNFTKNNTLSHDGLTTWSLKVSTPDNDEFASIPDIGAEVKLSLTDCTNNNYLFRTIGQGNQVYIINKKIVEASLNPETQVTLSERLFNDVGITFNDSTLSVEERDKIREENLNLAKSDLTNYMIFITSLDMDTFNEDLKRLVIDAMKM